MEELTNFATQLKQSELLSSDKLRELLRQFQQAGREQGKRTAELTVPQLCEFLVAQDAVTPWQAEKLQAGRFRGFFLGKYKLLARLGAGGMSVVYLAENRVLGQKRAIKVLPKSRVENTSYLARFYKEARAAAALDHPNIVKTYDIDADGDQHFMVMEFVEGEDLSELVKRDGPVSIQQAVDFCRQAALALANAHQNGLIHRDVKPSNFLLANNGQIKLMDLGLAKSSDDTASLTMMHNETLMGTADYLSPEQALNSHEVDHRTDIYSLGGTFYFMLAGHPPFPEGSIAQRLVKHQSIDPPSLESVREDCPPFLSQMCQSLMKKKPEDRIQSCNEIAEALAQWQTRNPASEVANSSRRSAAEHRSAPKSPQSKSAPDEKIPSSKLPKQESPAASLPKQSDPSVPTAVPQVKRPNHLAAVTVAPTIAGREAIDFHDVHLDLPAEPTGKEHSAAESVDVGLPQHVATQKITIKTEATKKKNRPKSEITNRRFQKQDAKWLLISLVVMLVLAAGFLIWAFVFNGTSPPPVVD